MPELNLDGLVGPTHNYGGMSYGNLASDSNRGQESNPKRAALQGLSKMRAVSELGIPQAVMAPQERPFIPHLRSLGYSGSDADIIEAAAKQDFKHLAEVSSASSMWAANAATVCPSVEASDGRVHFTPANLVSMPHRAIEHTTTKNLLSAVFSDDAVFAVHDALPLEDAYGDEGAANHNRLTSSHTQKGLQVFVYGRESDAPDLKFPARQTLKASRAVADLNTVQSDCAVYIKQSPLAINAGAFHNDVVCVSNENVMFLHEHAFENLERAKDDIRKAAIPHGFDPIFVITPASEISLADAVSSYLFNSQLLTRPDGGMTIVLPGEAESIPSAKAMVDWLVAGDNPVTEARFFPLQESMRNGGGPACLRLRVPLQDRELERMNQSVLFSDALAEKLTRWVETHYRDRLVAPDLADPSLLMESRTALDELTQILDLGSVYDFQRASI